MKKALVLSIFLALFVPVFASAAGDYNPKSVGAGNPEIHIKPDGMASMRSGRVDQIAGTTFYLVLQWGSVPMRFTVKTDSRTVVTKRYGGSSLVSQIKVGDYLDVDGEFFVGSDFFGVNALSIKDWSLQSESEIFSGTVAEVQADSFTLRTSQNKNITVRLGNTGTMHKGSVSIPFGRLRKGDTVPVAAGVYDYVQNTLMATQILIHQAKSEFLPKNFEGTLKQIVSLESSPTLVISVGGNEYQVRIGPKTLVLKKNRVAVQLARFVVGDTVRFYGAVREEEKILQDVLVVEAEVVRNLSL